MYKLRGHEKSIVSLSWCPAPVNVFPRYHQNTVRNKLPEDEAAGEDTKVVKSESQSRIVEEKISEKQIKTKVNPWINLTHADDDEANTSLSTEQEAPETSDFLEECHSLKSKILGLDEKDEESDNSLETTAEGIELSSDLLENCENIKSKLAALNQDVVKRMPKEQQIKQYDNSRPLPTLFDPSEDILDNISPPELFNDELDVKEDKDCGDEKGSKEIEREKSDEEKLDKSEKSEDKKGTSEALKDECISKTDEEKTKFGTTVNQDKPEDIETLQNKVSSNKNEEESDVSQDEEETEKKAEITLKDRADFSKLVDGIFKQPAPTETVPETAQVPEAIEEEPRTEYLLASSGKDRNIYIWRAGTDGRMQTFMQCGKKSKIPTAWSCVHWLSPNTLISTTTNGGEIMVWTLPKTAKG